MIAMVIYVKCQAGRDPGPLKNASIVLPGHMAASLSASEEAAERADLAKIPRSLHSDYNIKAMKSHTMFYARNNPLI